MLRAIPKVGTRRKQWLIVNDAGGLVYEMTGSEREATRKAEAITAKRCECLATVPDPAYHDRMCPKYIAAHPGKSN
jgi:hypothetical protein